LQPVKGAWSLGRSAAYAGVVRWLSGLLSYDNTFGLPLFFPTRLRCEEYIYRLWVQQSGIAAAHVDAAQNHGRSTYMRNPPASEILNEEVSNLLKRKIYSSLTRLDELGIAFDYEGEVSAQDANEILEEIRDPHARVLLAAEATGSAERADALRVFASNLYKASLLRLRAGLLSA
jgi:hypothetical protein